METSVAADPGKVEAANGFGIPLSARDLPIVGSSKGNFLLEKRTGCRMS
jgi:hypothetical protein